MTFDELLHLCEDLNIIQKLSSPDVVKPVVDLTAVNKDIIKQIADLKPRWLNLGDNNAKEQMQLLRKELWDNKFLMDPEKTKTDLLKLHPEHPLRLLFKNKIKK